MIKFKKLKKRKFYPTWVSIKRCKGCKIFIMQMPDTKKYHFQIICDNCMICHASLDDGVYFDSFEECKLAVEKWMKELKA